MIEHTPGPWKLETVRTSCGICHKIGDFERLGMTRDATYGCVYDDYPAGEQSKTIHANARLMAAAPDLLRALNLVLPLAKGYAPVGQTDTAKATCRSWIEAAQEAISKATETTDE